MPYYMFQHPETQEVKEILMSMSQEHCYEENGVRWIRIFSNPNMACDKNFDPFSSQAWMDKTKNSKGNLGDLWDRSAELSEKRKKILGKDPIKEKATNEYFRKTQKRHPHE